MVYFKFIRNIDSGKSIQIYGDGTQSRDFTYIDDIVEGTVGGLKLTGYNIINLGNDKPEKLLDVLSLIEKNLGKKAKIRFFEKHPADTYTTWVNIVSGSHLLGWKPMTDLESGINKVVNWYIDIKDWISKLKYS